MSDDLLGTVKAALAAHDGHPDNCLPGCPAYSDLTVGWLRALVARCEQAEAELERLNSPVLKSDWQQMEADLAAARDELNVSRSLCRITGEQLVRSDADLAAERIENAHLRDAVQTFEKAYNLAHAVLDGATPATWMASADGTMLVRVLVAPWTAWGARGEQT